MGSFLYEFKLNKTVTVIANLESCILLRALLNPSSIEAQVICKLKRDIKFQVDTKVFSPLLLLSGLYAVQPKSFPVHCGFEFLFQQSPFYWISSVQWRVCGQKSEP